jgi:CxxC-x17-CxxC domain-containing protein
MSLQDQTLTCRDCGRTFAFTAAEQTFYAERELHTPTRCPDCRAERRRQRGGVGGAGAPAPRESAPRQSRGGASDQRAPRELFPAVCDNCGKDTQVPFMPRGDRPVYCRECFAEMRDR